MAIYFSLFWAFLKIGIFGFGGGYAMLSLIENEIVDRQGWLSIGEFTDIVAISQMTPGPIGINSATYVGYSVTGTVLGSLVSTLAVVLPSTLLMLWVSAIFFRARNHPFMQRLLWVLNPLVIALMGASVLMLFNAQNFFDPASLLIGVIAFVLTWKVKLHPVWTLLVSGLAGFLLY